MSLDSKKYEELQSSLKRSYPQIFSDPLLPRTVLVVPSLSLDAETLDKISGVHHYEERMLCILMLLRMPATKVIYVSSEMIAPAIIDYFLHLLPGIPANHARKRLKMFACHDASAEPLVQKILDRPRLVARIKNELGDLDSAHMTCFNSTELEAKLALELNIPLYACDPRLSEFGSKSGSRKIFKEADILLPEGYENLKSDKDLFGALVSLKSEDPSLSKVVVKLNEGFSGEGNAIFSYDNLQGELSDSIKSSIEDCLKFEAVGETWSKFSKKFNEMEGIVEKFVEGTNKRSPSVQGRINPLGVCEVVSTHDQVLAGPSGQVFSGCTFPADEEYRLEIQALGLKIGNLLAKYGVIGRFGVDFVSVYEKESWSHYAIEINVRKGGTTHPFMMLQFLTDGHYDSSTGLFVTKSGEPRFYTASDNLEEEIYKGLTPEDLIDISVENNLHFHGASQEGVVFHLIGALSEFGKLGVVCIGKTVERANELYQQTKDVLYREANQFK